MAASTFTCPPGLCGAPREQLRALQALDAAMISPDAGETGALSEVFPGSVSAVRLLDPVHLVRPFADPRDREVAGLFAALFAYGRVELVCKTVEGILRSLGPSPSEALRADRHLSPRWGAGFRYRFNDRSDLVGLCRAVGRTLREEGSLGSALARRRALSRDLPDALGRLVFDLRARALIRPGPSELSRGLRFLLADPDGGGAAKRWWLYLRWMVRPDDGRDLGVWSDLFRPAELLVPLDAHWVRIGPRLGMTLRRTPGPAMARDITEALRRISPEDPLRFDYAVCHLGIGGGCPTTLLRRHCRGCVIRKICRTGSCRR